VLCYVGIVYDWRLRIFQSIPGDCQFEKKYKLVKILVLVQVRGCLYMLVNHFDDSFMEYWWYASN
jgi:hypothetical protein